MIHMVLTREFLSIIINKTAVKSHYTHKSKNEINNRIFKRPVSKDQDKQDKYE